MEGIHKTCQVAFTFSKKEEKPHKKYWGKANQPSDEWISPLTVFFYRRQSSNVITLVTIASARNGRSPTFFQHRHCVISTDSEFFTEKFLCISQNGMKFNEQVHRSRNDETAFNNRFITRKPYWAWWSVRVQFYILGRFDPFIKRATLQSTPHCAVTPSICVWGT